jgi:predicted CoA-substrate-specific enzyme activase
VAANIGVVRALENVFELAQGELVVPDEHFFTGAIGAVLMARERAGPNGQIHLEKIDNYLAQRGSALEDAPRRKLLGRPSLPYPSSPVYEHLLSTATGPIEAYLGVDVGSISTKAAVIDGQNRLLAKHYLMTAGNPLEAVRQTLDIIGKKVNGKVNICGAATTGSGRYLTGDFIGADVVINEITAQAKGAAIVDPMVDTIFEIGGQDSKYISLENGVVVDFTMNHACAAGTGSFLEEQAQRLDISINRQFEELAFACHQPIKLGERCTVFMESDLLNYQQQGAKTSELVAGLSYSIVENYLNRVVGRRKIGGHICFQGGTAFNKAVWAAFEKVVGKPVMVPDHHEVTGAIGAAAIAADYVKKNVAAVKSNFRGFEKVSTIEYKVESFTCEHCPNHCEIKKVQLPEAEPLYYGSRCDRYNLKKKIQKAKGLGAFEYRRQMLFECAGLNDKPSKKQIAKLARRSDLSGVAEAKTEAKAGPSIGIPIALTNWQLLPLFAQFFKAMGFDVITSGQTDKRIIRMGVESVNAQPCFPVKAAYGHIAELIEKKVDHIFLPSIVSMTASFPQNKSNQLCPYVQSLVYQAQAAFGNKLAGTKILTVPIRLGEGQKLLRKSFVALGQKLGVSASAVRKAVKEGFSAQQKFELVLLDKGKEILGQLGPEQKLFVLISRPYNGCDEGLNLQLSKKLDELGVRTIPMDMLALDQAQLGDESLHKQVYWSYGQKILRAAEIIKNDPRLFAIYLSNFSCGPDSFLLTFFKDIMAQKPCLLLEMDEHSADAGVITRLEAFLDSLKHYRPLGKGKKPVVNLPRAQSRGKPAITEGVSRERTLYIPYMGDCAYGVAASFRAYGQPAEVMPLADEAALLQGRAFTSGKECLPCAITSGEMLKVIRAEGFDPAKAAFFMPSASGPCRFGMYSCLQRLILKYAGAEDVPVIAPNQDSGFYKQFTKGLDGSAAGKFMKDAWVAVVGIDLLRKLVLRLRPFAAVPHQAQQVYDRSIKQWTQAVEDRFSFSQMRRLMESITGDFAAIKLDGSTQKPMIGIVGEIYVRSHPFANSNLIARLEELGAVCDLASLAEWIYYTNFTRGRSARRGGQYRDWFTNVFQDYVQRRIEKTLAEPLERMLGKSGLRSRFGEVGLSEGPMDHVIELAAPYLHHSFEGEAILSVGKTIEYYHQGFGGVVNAMPFTCMPSTIVSTQTRRISADCANMPILNLSFDGQEDSTLTTRLEAFVEQVRSQQDLALRRVRQRQPSAQLVRA